VISGRDILYINRRCYNILELVTRQILNYTRPNVTRHITYWAKYPSLRFVIPLWKDPLNSLSEFISTKHILYMRHILYEHSFNWWAKDICIVEGEKNISWWKIPRDIWEKKRIYPRGNPHTEWIRHHEQNIGLPSI
jgi:hypothetical protein